MGTAMSRKLLALALLISALPGSTGACSSDGRGPGGNGRPQAPTAPPPPTFTLLALAEVRGQVEPCGCTTDPLGDIARTAALIRDARAAGPVLVVDAGSLLYSKAPVPPHLVAQEELKADLLAGLYKDTLRVDAIGLGPMDLARGPDKVRLPRVVVNLAASASAVPVAPPPVLPLGSTKVGVLGLVTADAAPGVAVDDPVTAGKRAAAQVRAAGAEFVVGLISATSRRDAVRLVREVGDLDLAVIGLGQATAEPDELIPTAEQEGRTWLVFPANRGQAVARVAVTVRAGAGPLVDAVGEAAAAEVIAQLDVRLAEYERELTAFAADPSADPAFVAAKRRERDEVSARRAVLVNTPLQPPASGSYFTLAHVRINKKLACDGATITAKTTYDRAAGAANAAAAAATPPLPVAKGAATYVGAEACTDCHDDAAQFWAKTRHAGAWATLERVGKQLDFDCIGCHTTGYDKPGGATLARNELLRSVQCETCHGPGSIHVAKDGAVGTLTRAPAPELCAGQCHTKEHSDTFQLEAYLRDVVGPGHGEARRTALGAGPTGRELRAAGLAKAGSAVGAGCSK